MAVDLRVGPSNEAVTAKRDGKMDGVDEGKDGGVGAAAAAAALCVACYTVVVAAATAAVRHRVPDGENGASFLQLVPYQASNIWYYEDI